MTQPTSSISATQAQLFVALMQAQSQSMAAAMDTTSTDSTASGGTQDFASLLTTALSTATPVGDVSQSGSTTTTVATTPAGSHIADIATQLAADLRGRNFASYDASRTPAAAQSAWNTPGWGNGNIQCVAFVDGVYRQAGINLPSHPNGADFWGAYANQPGFSEVANGHGLPQPGDIITFAGGAQGYGHVAVVTGVTPPTGGQPGRVTFAQSNSPTPIGSLPITADGFVTAWPGYRVQGFIHSNG
jgi:hypothetical protein